MIICAKYVFVITLKIRISSYNESTHFFRNSCSDSNTQLIVQIPVLLQIASEAPIATAMSTNRINPWMKRNAIPPLGRVMHRLVG